MSRLSPGKALGLFLATAGFAFIAAMTLVSYPAQENQLQPIPFTCLVCGDLGGEDVILNILLFVPLGVGLRLAGLARWKALGIAVLTTITVESLQYTVIAGRHASLSDLLTNSIGGWIGIALADHWRRLILPRPTGALRLTWFGMAIWLGIEMLSAALLSVSPPPTVYFGMWAPHLPDFAEFHGTVLSATLDGETLPGTRLDDSRKVASQLRHKSFALEITAVGDASESWLAPIVAVLDEQKQEILFLGQWGRDLFFRVRMRTGDFRLGPPALRLPDVLSTTPGILLRIRAGLDRGRLFLQLTRDGHEYRRELAMSPSWGWSFVLPYEAAFGPEVYFLTSLWIAGLLLPIAYWARRGATTGSERWRAGALLALLVGLGLGAVPLATGLPPVHWSEWVAAAAGMAAGWCLGSATRPVAFTT
jgi:VanZ family protein